MIATEPSTETVRPSKMYFPGGGYAIARNLQGLLPAVAAWALLPFLVSAAQAGADDIGALREVVVTAQKREEKAQDVPISMEVETGDDLSRQEIINIDDIGVKFPNVEMVLPFGPEEPQFSIRGVTETDFQPSQSSPIALYVDGSYKSVGALTSMALFDVDRVEVLRGPQGTVQGRNATGGAVNVYSVKPGFNSEAYVMTGVGNFGRWENQGAINLPLVANRLSVRAAWTATSVGGYIDNPLPSAPYGGRLSGVYDFGGRLSVRYKQGGDWDAILRLNYYWSDPVNYGVYAKDIPAGEGIGITPGSLAEFGIPQSLYSTSGYTRAGLSFFQTEAEDVHRRLITNHGINLEVNHRLSNSLKLVSITSYDHGKWDTDEDDDGTPINVDEARYFSRVNSTQEELRLLSSFGGSYDFIAGALYGRESLFQQVHTLWAGYQPAIVTDPATGVTYNVCLLSQFWTCDLRTQFNQKRQDAALYFNNSYRLSERLTLAAGARFTADSVGVENYLGGVSWIDPATQALVPEQYFIPGPGYDSALPNFGAVTDPGGGAASQSVSDRKWMGQAGLEYHLTSHNMLYTGWRLGFRGSAYNGAATFGSNTINAVKPETLVDYEIGSKNDFFSQHLQVNLAGFYYVYRNQQFATLDAETGLSEEYNLPKINSEGLEFNLKARAARYLHLGFGGAYNYAVYRSGENAGIDVAGNRVEEAPRWSFNGLADWRLYDGKPGTLDLDLNGNAVTKQYFDALNSGPAEQGAYSVWNARLIAEDPRGSASVALWAQNLFDRQYFTSIFNTDSTLNFSYAQRGLPRTYGLQLTMRFY